MEAIAVEKGVPFILKLIRERDAELAEMIDSALTKDRELYKGDNKEALQDVNQLICTLLDERDFLHFLDDRLCREILNGNI